MQRLGDTVVASSISYIDAGYTFIGSDGGDSKLLLLHPEADAVTGSCIEEVETYTNVGPIVDFAVIDLDRQGQGMVRTRKTVNPAAGWWNGVGGVW